MINIKAAHILNTLENAGFRAYLVGGCVRDMLMGREIHDFDITTNALPEQIIKAFSGFKVIPTGIKHGTVTVLHDGEPFEITTFRVDGEYSDSRRPDSVQFTSDLTLDLSRRDFTVNAIAMDKNGELHDPFSGRNDIEDRIIRCVGDPEKRFTEDALRILRAVRFASVLGFEIEKNTADSALALRKNLDNISAERIREELTKLVCGENVVGVMLPFRDIFGQIIPELIPCFDFDQHSKYHKYNVYEHIVRAVDAAPDDPILRTTMLYHDLGKPPTFRLDEKGVGHFKKHAQVGAEIAHDVMRRLKYDNSAISTVCTLIKWHSADIFTAEEMKPVLAEVGPDMFDLLMQVKIADNMAKNEFVLDENRWFSQCREDAKKMVADDVCLTMSQLAVNGKDMIELGLTGSQIGHALRELLTNVVMDTLPNDRDALIAFVKENFREVSE